VHDLQEESIIVDGGQYRHTPVSPSRTDGRKGCSRGGVGLSATRTRTTVVENVDDRAQRVISSSPMDGYVRCWCASDMCVIQREENKLIHPVMTAN